MDTMRSDLKLVPAVNTQELLFYINRHFPSTCLKITTNSGVAHTGIVVTMGPVKNSSIFLVLQISSEQHGTLNRFLHLDVSKVESIELIEPADAMAILSLGNLLKNGNYEESGTLEVKRAFQLFCDTIFSETGVMVGVPTMALPASGFARNRILKLSQKIQHVIINDILKEADARTSWKSKFNMLAFVDNDSMEVKATGNTVAIHFPFENLNAPEISKQELTTLVMAVL